MDNLEFWNSVQETDPDYTKKAKIAGGMNITAINATSQVKKATEKWGMYGSEWGLKEFKYNRIDGFKDESIMYLVNAIFFYPSGSFEISSSIKVQSYNTKHESFKIDFDFAKKVETDILTKALSKLGFNSDIFMGMYDDNKYFTEVTEKYKNIKNESILLIGLEEISKCKSILEVQKVWSKYTSLSKNEDFKKSYLAKQKEINISNIEKVNIELSNSKSLEDVKAVWDKYKEFQKQKNFIDLINESKKLFVTK